MKRASGELLDKDRLCLCCGKPIVTDPSAKNYNGLKSTSGLFKLYESVPWCKKCVQEMYKAQYNLYGDYRTAMFYLCKLIDYPYIPTAVDATLGDADKTLSRYFQYIKMHNIPEIKKGFAGSKTLSERDLPLYVEAEVVDGDVIEYSYTKDKSTDNLYEKWGRNRRYTQDDYSDLEEIYDNIASQNGIIKDDSTGRIADKVTEMAVIEAAQNLLHSRKCRNAGDADDAKKYYDLYDKAMGSQLLRGKDLKDKQIGDVLIQDIVKHCESEEFIEPWDRVIKYPHKKDVVDQVLLHLISDSRKLFADIFNAHVDKLTKLPKEYKLNGKNDEFADEETEADKVFDKALKDIADFKARQHISDDESDEDSADLDEDIESDAALLGEVD